MGNADRAEPVYIHQSRERVGSFEVTGSGLLIRGVTYSEASAIAEGWFGEREIRIGYGRNCGLVVRSW